MEDTRTSSVIQIGDGGESKILRTGGGELDYRQEEGISPRNTVQSAGTENNGHQMPGVVPHENAEVKTSASVSVTSYTGRPAASGINPDPHPTNSQDDKDGTNFTIDKSKMKSRTESWSPTRTHKIHPLSDQTGNDNLAFDGTEAPKGNEPTPGLGNNQTPVSHDQEQKQWQFMEVLENQTNIGQVSNNYRATDIPIVSGITKKHNFEKGFASNGVANGTVFPEHGHSTLSEISSKLETEEQRRERKKQEKRDRNPLIYCKFVCSRPKTAFALTLGGHICFVLITVALMVSGYDVFPVVFDRLPLDIQDDQDFLRGLAWDNRDQDKDIVERGSSSKGEDLGTSLFENLVIIFDEEGGNCFTQENLRHIQRVENDFVNVESYKEKYCLRNSENQCSKPQSILRFFDGTYAYVDPVFNDSNFNNIPAVLYAAQTYDDTKEFLSLFVAKDVNITQTRAESWITRMFFPVGWPLAGYTSTTDREDDQRSEIEDFYTGKLMPLGDKYFEDDITGSLTVSYGSRQVQELYLFSQVIFDLMLAFGSFCFIAIFMRIQTGSFWVTGFAIMSILTSFAGTNLIYRVILDFRYIGIFHILSVFIILGIGADDVFIFMDTWKETGHHQYKSLAHRLSDVYRRATLAMFFTSLTTAMAFAVSATSPFLAIYSFGVFSCILVAVNYISVILFFPTVIITYHLYWEKFKCCCCCAREGIVEAHPSSVTVKKEGAQRQHPIVKFFNGPYYRFITHPVWRWVIIVFYVVLLSVFIYFASQIQVNEEQTKFVSEKTNMGYYLERASSGYFKGHSARRTRVVYLIWGMKNQDLSDCHKTDALCVGDSVWDDEFDLSSVENQKALQMFCNNLLSLDSQTIEDLHIKVNPVTNLPEVNCFSEHLHTFLQEEQDREINGTRRYPNGTALYFPTNSSMVDDIMEHNPTIYNTSVISQDFNSTIETAISFWLYNGFQPGSKGWKKNILFDRFSPLLGESIATDTTVVNQKVGFDYYYGTKLRYISITINTTIFGPTLGYQEGIPLRDKWEDFFSKKIESLPVGLNKAFQTTPEGTSFNLWHWLKIQRSLIATALQGIIVGLCVALPILMIATMNFVSGLYATLILVCITTMVLGLIPMAGWKIGILESLNLVLVVGLAVDYVVHLAEGYGRSEHKGRKERTRDTLTEVGISVLSGAVTTVGASLFMLGAKILFFVQFGVFVLSTLGFSLLFALGLFTTVCALIGPQDNVGSIKSLFKSCKRN